jgi:hypothetical protein
MNMNMKKVLIPIVVFLFTATVTSYAEIIKNQVINSEKNISQYEVSYGNSSIYIGEDSGFDILFRVPAENRGGRPIKGEGNGNEAPLKDGLPVLMACCTTLLIVKVIKQRRTEKVVK